MIQPLSFQLRKSRGCRHISASSPRSGQHPEPSDGPWSICRVDQMDTSPQLTGAFTGRTNNLTQPTLPSNKEAELWSLIFALSFGTLTMNPGQEVPVWSNQLRVEACGWCANAENHGGLS